VLLFLNQDTVAHAEWFEPLMSLFEYQNIGIAGPKLITKMPDGDRIQSCGGLYGGNKGPFHRYLGWAADDWRVNIIERVSWMTGAALAVRRDLFFKVGGFDVGYERGYFEDVDLCEKVKEAGFEVWYCPEAVFEHYAGTSGGVPPHIFKANSMHFHEKWDAKIKPDTQVSHVAY
jgi:O-antigen biosynthesis protein